MTENLREYVLLLIYRKLDMSYSRKGGGLSRSNIIHKQTASPKKSDFSSKITQTLGGLP